MATYELRAVKEAGGDETPRFEAQIYCDGKRIAQVSNGGTGGCHDYYFFDREAEAAFDAYCTAWWETSDAKKEMVAYFEAHPLPGAKLEYSYTEKNDHWVYAEIERLAFAKRIKRVIKTKAVFTLKGDEKDSYRTLNKPCSPAAVQWLHSKYGDKLDVIFDPVTAQPLPADRMVAAANRAAPSKKAEGR